MKKCKAAILAAGSSERMGRPKQLLELSGETFIERSVRVALASDFDEVAVVLGAYADDIAPRIAGRGVRILHNADWQEGMASSVRCAVHALSDADGLMILLVDQPGITAEWLMSLVERFRREECDGVTSSRDGVTSPPAIFSKTLFPQMLLLQGERGAKSLLAGAKVIKMEFPGLLIDIDTPGDFEKLSQA